MTRTKLETSSLAVAVVLVTAAFLLLLVPYYSGVLWAVILAILFGPVYRWLLARTRGRRNLSAALSVLACVFIVLIPGSIVLQSLVEEVNRLYDRAGTVEFDVVAAARNVWDNLPAFIVSALSWIGLTGPDEFQAKVTSLVGEIANAAAGLSVEVGRSTVQLGINLGIMLYTLFFLFRDGASLVSAIRKASPLSDRQTDHIIARFASAVKATVKGNLIIALLQGTLGGIMLGILGLQAALLWGVMMAILALLPVVGAAIVWLPVALYLLIMGETAKGIILFLFGALVISLVDNLLRPVLVGRDLRLPDFVILITTVGGIALIGANGFVIGPMIAALFVAVWSLVGEDPSPD